MDGRAQAESQPLDAARRIATVLITDMEGSTALTEGRGDDAAMDLLRTHERLVREVVAAHGGREIKSMGDGFMIAFDACDQGLACAVDIQKALGAHNTSRPDQPILVRMGMNVGSVIEEGGDLYGTTVNAAARIVAKARSGQIIVSAAVRDLAGEGGDWTFIDRGPYWLKGLRERWILYEVARPDAPPPTHAPEGVTPFINREDERATLRVYVDAALDGRGGLILLSGDAGAGKTRLAEEVGLEAGGRGMRFLVGRCYEASRSHPFGPLVDVLESVERAVSPERFRAILGEAAPEIARLIPHVRRRFEDVPASPEVPDPDQARRYLFTSIREVLVGMARERPLFLLLDDLQWADDPSLMFLEQLAQDLTTLPILVVGTYIPAEPGATRRLQTVIERLHRRRLVERLSVGPLAEEHLAELLTSLVGREPPMQLVRLLYRETEGNVFFAEEVVRHLLEEADVFDDQGAWRADLGTLDLEIPETVLLTIGRRLDALEEQTRSALAVAALIGRGFGFDLLRQLTESGEDELIDVLDEAERARIITSTSEGGAVQFRFSHELIRHTLVGELSLARRQRLHHQIAQAMEHVFAVSLPEHAADIAYHLTEAGRRADAEHTVRFCVMAGDRALDAAAYEESLRHLDRALSLLPSDSPERAGVLEKLGMAERSLGHPDDAISTWHEALDAYERSGDMDSVARLCLTAGIQVALWLRRRETFGLSDRGLAALGTRQTAERAGLVALRAMVASGTGTYDEAMAYFDEALSIARAYEDDQVLGMVLYSEAAHHFNYGQFAQAVSVGRESIEHLRRAGDIWNLANALAYVGQSLGWLGRFEEAAKVGAEAEPLARRLGNWSAVVYADRARAWQRDAARPDPAERWEAGQRDRELGHRLGYRWMVNVGNARMSHAAFMNGRWDDAISLAAEAARYETGATTAQKARLFMYLAYNGDRDAATSQLDVLRTGIARPGRPNTTGAWNTTLFLIEGLAVLGEAAAAAELYPIVVEQMQTGTLFRGWDLRLLQTVAGIAATCARDWDVATHHFQEALRLTRELPFRLEEPEACRFYAQMLIDRGRAQDTAEASELLRRALVEYSAMGMPRHEQLVQALLDQTA